MSTTLIDVESEAGNTTSTTRPGRWRRLAAAALVASATLTAVAVDAAPAGAGTVCGESVESDAQNRFVSKLNSLRRSRGLSTLVSNGGIAGTSDQWSVHMSSTNTLAHDPNYSGHIARIVPDWSRAAENVGYSTLRSCSSSASVVDTLHDAFVNSSGHFRNMIGDFNQVGIGVHIDSDQMWVTVRFAKGTAPKPAPAPAQPSYTSAQLSAAAEYISAAYDVFLGRPASGGEVAFWSESVAGGDRTSLTRALAVSNEWSGTRVAALYQTVLGRDAEASGLRGWVDAIARGMQLETVAVGIYGSPERFQISGSTNRGYVEGLYEDILGRAADAGGRDYWVSRLDRRSMSRTKVAVGFYDSLESRRDRVHTLYADILGRAPDAVGLSYWTNRIGSLGDVALASTLATSREFWLRATS